MSIERTVRSNGDVRWRVRWREDGGGRTRTFTRKEDARTWDDEVRRRKRLGPLAVEQLTASGPTLSEWIADRWAPEHGSTLETATRTRYADVYRLHVAPFLGGRPLRELTVSVLREWQSERLKASVTPGTIGKARTFLSSVLRHAAESEVIVANPMALVRAPKTEHRDAVRPLAPATVEKLRAVLAGDMSVVVPERTRKGGIRVESYTVADERDPTTRIRDAAILSILAYAGLRPGELRGLRWGDIGKATITVERAADDDGNVKGTKTSSRRSVRLLAPLAADLKALRIAEGRPTDEVLILNRDGKPWDKTDWQVWRSKRWARASKLAGLPTIPRPYDLRHSFASLLLAEGRAVHYVARQLGHSPTLTLTTYGHLFAEYEDADRIDAEAEIRKARANQGVRQVSAVLAVTGS